MFEEGGARLIEERKRLGLTQDAMAAAAGVAKSTYCNYEAGKRAPDAPCLDRLAKAGANVLYIVTGQKALPGLTVEHQNLIDAYEAVPEDLKRAVFGVLLSFGQTELDAVRMAKRGEGSKTPLPGEIIPNSLTSRNVIGAEK